MSGGELSPDGKQLLPPDAFGILLIGASGTGKSSTAAELQALGIVEVKPTAATRERRPVETAVPPCDHIFLSKAEFNEWDEQGWFIATELIYGSTYGVPWFGEVPEGRVPLMVMKPVFVRPVLAHYPYMRTYQIEASEATVRSRMHARGQSDTDIAERLRQHAVETAVGRRLADCIFKNEGPLARTTEQFARQIQLDHASYLAAQAVPEPSEPGSATMELPYDATETFA